MQKVYSTHRVGSSECALALADESLPQSGNVVASCAAFRIATQPFVPSGSRVQSLTDSGTKSGRNSWACPHLLQIATIQ
jgi:hypothetical protein